MGFNIFNSKGVLVGAKRKKLTEKQKIFAEWFISVQKEHETQNEFAAKHGVTPQTLINWKREKLWQDYVKNLYHVLLNEDYPEVIRNLANRAKKDNVAARIYLDHKDKIDGRLEGLGDGSVVIIMPDRKNNKEEEPED